MLEGTRVTQNVKTWSKSLRGQAVALGVLVLGALLAAGGCSSNTKASSGNEAGSGECSGDACKPVLSGRFTPCDTDAQCDTGHGFSCIDGECNYECEQHSDCIEVGHCEARTVEGARRQFCVHDAKPPVPGELYTACPKGNECADARLCIGAGPGDLDAYCTIGCSGDDDCGVGYYCGTITRPPCQAACGQDAAPSDPRCVPPDQIGKGAPFYCSPLGSVERKVCRQREFCATCDSDADCLAVPNQVCAKDKSGEKICTRLCDQSTRSCPWGNASECAVFDEDLGLPTCGHRFGQCHGDGGTCEPCRTNQDCPNGACASSSFTGERWCINFGTKCACKNGVDNVGFCNDGGCPNSPGDLTVKCVGEPSSSLVGICYAGDAGTETLAGSSSQTGCWPPL